MRTTAPPLQVWEAWADPEKFPQRFADNASGEARPGGKLKWSFEKFGEFVYDVAEAVPEKRLVLTGMPRGLPRFFLEIVIEKDEGETVVNLINSGFIEGAEWDDGCDSIDSGRKTTLAVLKHYLEQYFGASRRQFVVMRPGEFSYEDLLHYYRDAEGLAEWLTSSGEIGRLGEPYHLVLKDGQGAKGRVLCLTPRQTTLTWEEIGGVLEFLAFSAGAGQRMLAVRAQGWNLDPDRAARLEESMNDALGRLAAILSSSAASGLKGRAAQAKRTTSVGGL